jgi:AcrR family transcriptional regulator
MPPHAKGPDTPRLILDVARELFAAEGYEAVTMKKIADRLGITPTAIYFHFADKAALIEELTTADWTAFARKFEPALAEPDPIARLRLAAHGYIEFARAHPNHYRLLFMTPPRGPAPPRRGDAGRDIHAMIHAAVVEALATGRFRPQFTDATIISQALWASVHGIAALHIVKGANVATPFRNIRRTTELTVDALLYGLLSPRARTKRPAPRR